MIYMCRSGGTAYARNLKFLAAETAYRFKSGLLHHNLVYVIVHRSVKTMSKLKNLLLLFAGSCAMVASAA